MNHGNINDWLFIISAAESIGNLIFYIIVLRLNDSKKMLQFHCTLD